MKVGRLSTSFSHEEVLILEAVLSRVINSTDPMQRNTSPALVAAYRKFLAMAVKGKIAFLAKGTSNGTAAGHE